MMHKIGKKNNPTRILPLQTRALFPPWCGYMWVYAVWPHVAVWFDNHVSIILQACYCVELTLLEECGARMQRSLFFVVVVRDKKRADLALAFVLFKVGFELK